MKTLLPLVLAAGFVWACNNTDSDDGVVTQVPSAQADAAVPMDDADGDGLDDDAEAAAGTDPARADTDDDGLPDGEELTLGTDPLNADSDGDGYPDGAEVAAERDPLDPAVGLYTGGWPFYAGKDEMMSGGFAPQCPGPVDCECTTDADCESGNCHQWPRMMRFCAPVVGTRIPRFVGIDQYGERVELYDFAYQGKLVVLDMSTGWCRPCQELAQWFSDGDPTVYEQTWWKPEWNVTRELVQNGEIYWITVLYENADHAPADAEIAQFWHDAFPSDHIPVLADPDKDLHRWLKPSGIPNVHVLDEELRFLVYSSRGASDAFDYLAEQFGE